MLAHRMHLPVVVSGSARELIARLLQLPHHRVASIRMLSGPTRQLRVQPLRRALHLRWG